MKQKLAPKGIKICAGCPPKEAPVIKFPKFKMSLPNKSSKVTTLKGEDNPHKKMKKGDSTILF